MRAVPRSAKAVVLACALGASAAHAGFGTAVEFYNPALRHYFVTAYPEEVAALDAGTNVKGWQRTGGQFAVLTDPAPGLQAVCRFFGTPGVGPNSHFYTADAAECAKVKTLPAWTFESIAFYIPVSSSGQCAANQWPVYRSYYSDQISDANHRFTVDLTAHARMPLRRGDVLEGIVMCAPVTDAEREADVVRFLEQATLGPTEALVQEVKAKGISAWLEAQLPMNVTRYTQPPRYGDTFQEGLDCQNDTTPPATPQKYCALNKMSPYPVVWEFYRQSKTAPDQVRMRMAHVWDQIFVIKSPHHTYVQADFHQRIRDHALGTFESILARYVLSPQLGFFQNWIFNVPEHDGIKPNENFAREFMQLFTIGVAELGEDGTPKLDPVGKPIASYTQADIEALARVLTGFAWPTEPGASGSFFGNPAYFLGDMSPFDAFHDQGAKSMFAGSVQFPAGPGALAEVRAAIHALAEHSNTPSFIARQLIQKTVTSSPTPGYVKRVADVFRNNGMGVRGDLAAVARAILLDPEARGARKIDGEYGRLREPVLFWTAMIRALDVTTDGFLPQWGTALSGQDLFSPPSVFSYYPADFTLVGTSIPAPEFGIFSSSELLNRANQVNMLLYSSDWPSALVAAPFFGVPNATGTPSPALAAFLSDANRPDALVDRLDRLFLHGTMDANTRQDIVNAIGRVADARRRVKLAINLILLSIDYQVQK